MSGTISICKCEFLYNIMLQFFIAVMNDAWSPIYMDFSGSNPFGMV